MIVDANPNTEADRVRQGRQTQAEGEARVKNVHINTADIVDNRPLKALLFHHNYLLQPLKSCKITFLQEGWANTKADQQEMF